MFVIVETFLNKGEASDAPYRVRPVAGQKFPRSMRVQCSRALRNAFPLGTRFRLPVDLVENKTGAQFLREIGEETWVPLAEHGDRVIEEYRAPKGEKIKRFLDGL